MCWKPSSFNPTVKHKLKQNRCIQKTPYNHGHAVYQELRCLLCLPCYTIPLIPCENSIYEAPTICACPLYIYETNNTGILQSISPALVKVYSKAVQKKRDVL